MIPEDNRKRSQPYTNRLYLKDGAGVVLTLAAIIIILLGLQQASSVVVPILMASFLAVISYSVTVALRRYLKFPHWLAVSLTVVVDSAIIYGVFMLIRFLAADMKATLQGDLIARFTRKYEELMGFLDNIGIGEQARGLISSPTEIINPQNVLSMTQALTGFMTSTALVLVLMTFLLGETPLFRRNLDSLGNSEESKNKVVHAVLGIQRYLFIKTVASAITGLLAWGVCAWMNVPFAFLWGLVAYLLNYIPTIGSIAAAIPPILLAMSLGTWTETFVVAGGYLAINSAIGNCIEPLFLGKEFGIATSVVLLSVMLWGWVLGPCGMLLAVPITVLLKLAMENSQDLAWIAKLIDDSGAEKSRKAHAEAENATTASASRPKADSPLQTTDRNTACMHSRTKTAPCTARE